MERNNKILDSIAAEEERKRQKKLAFDKRYLRMAKIWSENSYAIRRKVGCLIVKDNMIISDGYNGTPSGFPNAFRGFTKTPMEQLYLVTI